MSKNEWFVHLDGENIGPLSAEKVTLMLQQNRLQFVDFIWSQELTKWYRIHDLDHFAPLMPAYPKIPVPRIVKDKVIETLSGQSNEKSPSIETLPEEKIQPAIDKLRKPMPVEATPSAAKVWPKYRKFTRVPAQDAKVTIADHGNFPVVNISQGGIFLKSHNPLSMGLEVKFQLLLPGNEKALQMTGVVIRLGEADKVVGFAVEFTRLNPAHKRILLEFLVQNSGEA